MGLDATGAPKASGLKTALDTVIAPKEAFEQLAVAPTWGWALLLVIVIYAVASYLMTPALLHATVADWPRQVAENPKLAQMTPDQQQQALNIGKGIVQWAWLFAPIIALLAICVQSVIMWIFKALGKGNAPFRALWASAVNIQVPALGVGALITAVIVLARGADSFNSAAEIQTAMPSLGLLVPASAIKLHAFASSFNPFTLWGCGLTIAAMALVARLERAWAWATGIVWLLLAASLIGILAR
ncbi:MAG: hypothetical protein WB615_04135 [Candidatus Tumulicola sp.]